MVVQLKVFVENKYEDEGEIKNNFFKKDEDEDRWKTFCFLGQGNAIKTVQVMINNDAEKMDMDLEERIIFDIICFYVSICLIMVSEVYNVIVVCRGFFPPALC